MRTILDGDFATWEAYATTGAFGSARPARIAFRCTSDAGRRPRVIDHPGDKAEAERAVAEAPDAELLEMLERARAVR
jgi:hypothetical protein